jgi:hypothetical protein
MRRALALAVVVAWTLGAAAPAHAADEPWRDPSLPPAARADALLHALSFDQKVRVALGNYAAVASFGVPALSAQDGPSGIRADGTTSFPSSQTLAASFDRGLARAYGEAIAAEARGKPRTAVEPTIDLATTPPDVGPLWSARWTGTLTPTETGLYRFSLLYGGTARLFIDDRLVASGYRDTTQPRRAALSRQRRGTAARRAPRLDPHRVHEQVGSVRGADAPGLAAPVRFAASDEHGPAPPSRPERYPGISGQERYDEGIFVGYRWYDRFRQRPLFEFGYGLSYARFRFDGLRVRADRHGDVVATVRVTNTGDRAGSTGAQAYVGFPRSAGEPPQQLKGYEKVALAPGGSARVVFRLEAADLAIFDLAAGRAVVPHGRCTLSVGSSSRDLSVRASFRLGRQRHG